MASIAEGGAAEQRTAAQGIIKTIDRETGDRQESNQTEPCIPFRELQGYWKIHKEIEASSTGNNSYQAKPCCEIKHKP